MVVGPAATALRLPGAAPVVPVPVGVTTGVEDLRILALPPRIVDRGDLIVHAGAPRGSCVQVGGSRAAGAGHDIGPVREVGAMEHLDPVAGDRALAGQRRRSCPVETDRSPLEGRHQVRRLRRYLNQRHGHGRRGNERKPAGHRGGNHEEAGRQAQSVPNHLAASFRAVEKTCARPCVKSISMGWRTFAPAPRGLVIAATPPRPASRG